MCPPLFLSVQSLTDTLRESGLPVVLQGRKLKLKTNSDLLKLR